MDDANRLHEQLEYYRARANEYDATSVGGHPAVDAEWNRIVQAVQALGPQGSVLELACGTGQWTQHLATLTAQLTALDGAAEMLAVNQRKLANPAIHYAQADLFAWQPQAAYDLVFAAFWLSHVPPARLPGHLAQVARAVKPGGTLFLADEPAGGQQLSGPSEAAEQERQLSDGSRFRIVKVYYEPQQLADELHSLGFSDCQIWQGEFFYTLTAHKPN